MMARKKNYRAGVYLRSCKRCSEYQDIESKSIFYQKESIRTFLMLHKEIQVVSEYSDDGFFADSTRPAYSQMLKDISAGKIDCVLVKNIDRLERTSAMLGKVAEEYFLANDVKIIDVASHSMKLFTSLQEYVRLYHLYNNL